MNIKVRNLAALWAQQSNALKETRLQVYELARKLVAENEIAVPVNKLFDKKKNYTPAQKHHESVMLDSYPVDIVDPESSVAERGYISKIYFNKEEETAFLQVYTARQDSKGNYILRDTPIENILEIAPVLEYINTFCEDDDLRKKD